MQSLQHPIFFSSKRISINIISSLIRLVKYFLTYFIYNYNMMFQERIKELRIQRGLSQMDLSKATGISQSAIAKWELGKTEPTASAIITLAKYFEESADYILGIIE